MDHYIANKQKHRLQRLLADYFMELSNEQAEKIKHYPEMYQSLEEYRDHKESGYNSVRNAISTTGAVIALASFASPEPLYPLVGGGLTFGIFTWLGRSRKNRIKDEMMEAIERKKLLDSQEELEDIIRKTLDPNRDRQKKIVNKIYSIYPPNKE
jgi:hypothetical protein